MKRKTFAEWRATRHFACWTDEGSQREVRGVEYDGELRIELTECGQWYLQIGNREWLDWSIQECEVELYNFYLTER